MNNLLRKILTILGVVTGTTAIVVGLYIISPGLIYIAAGLCLLITALVQYADFIGDDETEE